MSPTLELEEPLVEILDAPDESAGLVTIKRTRVSDLFEAPGLMQMLLNRIQEEAKTFVPDTTTAKGRELIASQAFRVSKTKTYLEGLGKALVDDLKERPKRVDATRKLMRDTLDTLRDDQRKPLTDWEAERDRQRAIVDEIRRRPTTLLEATADQIATSIEALEGEDLAIPGAAEAKAEALQSMRDMLEKRRAYEAEQAELKRLREEEAARKQKDEEDRIRREATEKAQQEAEDRIRQEREDSERREREAREAAEKAEREKREAEERLERERKESAEREEKARQEATENERRRQEETAKKEREEAEARERNRSHRQKINREAMEDIGTALFQHLGQTITDTEGLAKVVVAAIAKGQVRNVSITY